MNYCICRGFVSAALRVRFRSWTISVTELCWPSPGLLCIGPAMLRKARRHRGTSRHRPSVDSRQPIFPVRRQQERVGVHPRRPRDSRRLRHVGSSRRRRRFCDRQLHGQDPRPRLRRRRFRRMLDTLSGAGQPIDVGIGQLSEYVENLAHTASRSHPLVAQHSTARVYASLGRRLMVPRRCTGHTPGHVISSCRYRFEWPMKCYSALGHPPRMIIILTIGQYR